MKVLIVGLFAVLAWGQVTSVPTAAGGGGGSGDVTSSGNVTDNSVVRGDGGGKGIQGSACSIDDNGQFSCTGSGTGAWDLLKGTAPASPSTGHLRFFWNASGVAQDKDENGTVRSFAYITSNVATATALAANPTACPAGQYVSDIAADGTLTCETPSGGSSFNPLDMNTTYVRDTFTHTKAIASDHWNSDSGSWEFGGTCTIANTVGSVGHDGVLSVTATTNATICVMRTNPTIMQITAGTANVGTEVRFHFRLLNATNVTFGIGMWDSFSQTYGFGVRFIAGTDTNFMFLRNNSGATTVDSGVTPNTSNWYVFRARVTSNGTWSFDISENGGAWSTAKTACAASCDLAAIPTEALKPHLQLTPAEAASKVAYIDDFGAKIVRGGIHP